MEERNGTTYFAQSVGLGERLVRHILELFRNRVGTPSCRVVLNHRILESGRHLNQTINEMYSANLDLFTLHVLI